MSDEEYIKISIQTLIDDPTATELDLYLKLSDDKILKIANKNEPKKSAIDKYLAKDIEFLYLEKTQYDFYVEKIYNKFQEPITNQEDKPSIKEQAKELRGLNTGYETLKSLFEHKTIDDRSIDVAKAITKRALHIVREGQTLKNLQEYRKECGQEFMRSIITSHVCCFMLDYFDWANDSIKEKVVLGSILCDITLRKKDFIILKSHKDIPLKLPDHIKNHPYQVAKLLSLQPGLVEPDTLIMIEQHHEIPGKQGFPKNLHHSRISPLTAVFIVGNYFVEQLMSVPFKEELKQERIENILSILPTKFAEGHFKKAADAIYQVLMVGRTNI